MSVGLRAVQWNRDKIVYDVILLIAVVIFIGVFVVIHIQRAPPSGYRDLIDIWLRAFGVCAYLMLTVILCIGPLARLDRRFLPLLYNRRHFGVLTFIVAAIHGWLMIEWYRAGGELPNLWAELTAWQDYAKFIGFPFKTLGIVALAVLFLMAATSHDFWLMFLSPPVWKALHMALYVAYGLVVMHVALGIMQGEHTLLIPLMLIALGHTNAEVAQRLFLSVRTVESHRARVQQKLGCRSRAELVRHALDRGLLRPARR